MGRQLRHAPRLLEGCKGDSRRQTGYSHEDRSGYKRRSGYRKARQSGYAAEKGYHVGTVYQTSVGPKKQTWERIVDIFESSRRLIDGGPTRVASTDELTPGDPYEIMPDGYARGFHGDHGLMRANERTVAALRRQAEAMGKDEKGIRAYIASKGYPVMAMGMAV